MKINSKYLGLAVAITAVFLWSVYTLSCVLLTFLTIALIDGADYPNIGNFNWTGHLNKYVAQLVIVIFTTGTLGWAVGKIYNDLNEMFSIKLK